MEVYYFTFRFAFTSSYYRGFAINSCPSPGSHCCHLVSMDVIVVVVLSSTCFWFVIRYIPLQVKGNNTMTNAFLIGL